MLPTPIIANVCEVDLRFTTNGKPGENTFFYKSTAAWTYADMQALAVAFESEAIGAYRSCTCSSMVFTSLHLLDRRTVGGSILDYPLVGSPPGVRAGLSLPGNVAFNIVRRSLFSGRSNKGSIRMAGFSENDVTLNTVSNSLLQSIAVFLSNMSQNLTNLPWQPAVASPKLGTAKALITWRIPNPITDSQKTRIRHVTS